MKNRRSRLLIEPRFQLQFILRLTGWVTLSTILTAVIAVLIVFATNERLAGDFFYVAPKSGTHPIWLSLWQLTLPALAVCLPVNLTLTLLFSLYYSQKLAGPLHRLEQDMLKAARGEKTQLHFQLRESDEFQEVAHAFDALLKRISEHRAARKR